MKNIMYVSLVLIGLFTTVTLFAKSSDKKADCCVKQEACCEVQAPCCK